jgi:hypothetical protein
MKPLLLTTLTILPLLSTTRAEEDPPKLESWTVTVIRSDATGKELAKTRVPFAYNPKWDEIWGTTSIAMGTPSKPLMWSINFGASGKRGEGSLDFAVRSSMLKTTLRDGTKVTRPFAIAEARTTWHGPGRYHVLSVNSESITAEILPNSPQQEDRAKHHPARTIEVTRKDGDQEVRTRSAAPWSPNSKGDHVVHLPLSSGRDLQLVECEQEKDDGHIQFRVRQIVRLDFAQQIETVELFSVRVPLNDTGRYLIYSQDYSQDGETLEAIIRTTEPAPAEK